MAYNLNYKVSLDFWLKQSQQNNTFAVFTKLNCKVHWEGHFVLHATFTFIPDMQLNFASPENTET